MSVIEPECQQQQNESTVNAEQQQEGDLSRIEEEPQQDQNTDTRLRASDDGEGSRDDFNSPEDALMIEEKRALKEEDMKDEEEHRSLNDELEAVLNERQELIQKFLILQKMLNSLKISNDPRSNP
ncbi:predicted protein [Chaetoceros tenuissimus]|uniref:Uncharacterized protein n=1 Tax=Chaetoceros tenuissimus TaxID=426638 RepID=A0AAD3D4X6_9STRA|nr:predicted protein [Chaetoceros tenuissimus]